MVIPERKKDAFDRGVKAAESARLVRVEHARRHLHDQSQTHGFPKLDRRLHRRTQLKRSGMGTVIGCLVKGLMTSRCPTTRCMAAFRSTPESHAPSQSASDGEVSVNSIRFSDTSLVTTAARSEKQSTYERTPQPQLHNASKPHGVRHSSSGWARPAK